MGKILEACELTVGSRLHSAIISMNFATPAIAINYEHKSAGIMQQLGLPEMAIDIRHLLDGSLQAMVADTFGHLPALNARLKEAFSRERLSGMQMVAITLRELAPFDKRLGTTQQAYEKAFAGVVNRILDEGYQVIALSTCTGIDSYNKDDRMVALNLRQHISDPARYQVVMD